MKCDVVVLSYFCNFAILPRLSAGSIFGIGTRFYVLLALVRHQLIPNSAFPYVDCGSCVEINSLYQIQRASSYKLKLLHRAFATCRGTILEHKGHKAMRMRALCKICHKTFYTYTTISMACPKMARWPDIEIVHTVKTHPQAHLFLSLALSLTLIKNGGTGQRRWFRAQEYETHCV